ncbi:MAG: hypothetical protein A7315_08960 [Candidatus Altiarchaeales archaeon WOR_SM1_79]|nr:MAG: hypothetical protein A7315_08960 [Candidatus Altiarchaeales archaeon WOR_SM1_79]
MSQHKTFEKYCHLANKYFGNFAKDFKPSRKLIDSMSFAEIKIDPKEIYALAIASLIVPTVFILLLFIISIVLTGFNLLYVIILLVSLMLPAVLFYYIKEYPILTANTEKAIAVSYIPEIVSYLVMSLRINPNIEKAIKYTSDHSKGAFKKVLNKMMYNIRTGEQSAERSMVMLSEEWGDSSPEFKRSMRLIVASTSERSENRRQDTLDKATDVLLKGLSERIGESARALQTPVMMIFTFGVIMPLIFIALIPLASFMGLSVGPSIIALVYVVILPVILYIAINFIVSSRPATIPPVEIPESEHPKFLLMPIIAIAGVVVASPGILYLLGIKIIDLGPLSITPILLGVSIILSAYFLGTSYKIKKLRDEIAEMESEFAETVYQLGVILSEGRSLEDAMVRIKEMSKEATSAEIFYIAANNVRLFNMSLESAFFDSKAGSAKKVFSDMIKSTLETIIAISNRGSSVIAATTFRMSEHIKNMRSVDAEIKKTIGDVVSSMQVIAGVVGPLVGGMISSMSTVLASVMGATAEAGASGSAMMGLGGASPAEAIAPEIITIIIGIYVLETTLILISFSDDLVYGGDSIMKKYHLGLYLPIATIVFIISAWLAGMLIGGIAG